MSNNIKYTRDFYNDWDIIYLMIYKFKVTSNNSISY